jgi:hypothetical protein
VAIVSGIERAGGERTLVNTLEADDEDFLRFGGVSLSLNAARPLMVVVVAAPTGVNRTELALLLAEAAVAAMVVLEEEDEVEVIINERASR